MKSSNIRIWLYDRIMFLSLLILSAGDGASVIIPNIFFYEGMLAFGKYVYTVM